MIPCPGALVVLLSAVALQPDRVWDAPHRGLQYRPCCSGPRGSWAPPCLCAWGDAALERWWSMAGLLAISLALSDGSTKNSPRGTVAARDWFAAGLAFLNRTTIGTVTAWS